MPEVLRDWLMEDLQPWHRCLNGNLFSETRKCEVPLKSIRMNSEALRLLMEKAKDTPRTKTGIVNVRELQSRFKTQLEIAYDMVWRSLPLAANEEGGEVIKIALEKLFKTMVNGVEDYHVHRRMALGSWVRWHAGLRRGHWRQFGTYDAFGRIKAGGFEIALRPTLAGQMPNAAAHAGIAGMSQAELTSACREAGIAAEGDNRIHYDGREQIRITVLSAAFVTEMGLAYVNPNTNEAAEAAHLSVVETDPKR